ncbi:MAG: hypothetical protein QGG73_01080 [Candidatus Hydrogenedentes bacterium]|nr:hypothetical protein [Candidatus Hydrogenedentota bacterium]
MGLTIGASGAGARSKDELDALLAGLTDPGGAAGAAACAIVGSSTV